jgi:hypothetical protein
MTHRSDLINTGFVTVTPSDSIELNLVGVQVGGAGTLVITDGYNVVTPVTCVAGQVLTGQIKKIAASSTATLITGLVP